MADYYDSIPGERRYSGHEVYERDYTPVTEVVRREYASAGADYYSGDRRAEFSRA